MAEQEIEKQKRVLIVGGGVAGLSCGIYLRRAGFETIIFEKNHMTGGCCSCWFRKGYAVDNCLHWLTGTLEGGGGYQMWEELGVLGGKNKIVQRPSFWASEYEGVTLTLWRDVERSRREFLMAAPEDEEEIDAFFDCVNFAARLLSDTVTPGHILSAFNDTEFVTNHMDFAGHFARYLGLRNEAWVKRFKSPAIRSLILDFTAKEYESYWLIVAYAFFSIGNADLVEGGSLHIADAMTETYLGEGGKLRCGCNVSKVLIEKQKLTLKDLAEVKELSDVKGLADKGKDLIFRKAAGIELDTGEIVHGDYIVCATDILHTFGGLLKKNYAPMFLKRVVKQKKSYPFYTSFQVAFAVDGLFEEIPDTCGFACAPIECGYQSFNRISVKNYRIYGEYIAPKGQTVIQVMLFQYEKDAKYWKKLYQRDKQLYDRAKNNVALAVRDAIISKYPRYDGLLTLLDSWTPYSYERRLNSFNGSFMRFMTTVTSANAHIKNEVSGLDNVYLASHYLRYPGGLPMAALTGQETAMMIAEKEAKRAQGINLPIPFIADPEMKAELKRQKAIRKAEKAEEKKIRKAENALARQKAKELLEKERQELKELRELKKTRKAGTKQNRIQFKQNQKLTKLEQKEWKKQQRLKQKQMKKQQRLEQKRIEEKMFQMK